MVNFDTLNMIQCMFRVSKSTIFKNKGCKSVLQEKKVVDIDWATFVVLTQDDGIFVPRYESSSLVKYNMEGHH